MCFRFVLQGSLHLTKVTSWVKLWASGSLTQNTILKIQWMYISISSTTENSLMAGWWFQDKGLYLFLLILLLLEIMLKCVCVKFFRRSFPNITQTYLCWVSPARTRILWTSMLLLSESPDHQEETIFNMMEADQPFVSSHLNFSINKSPISFSVTSRNECVLFGAIFSFLTNKK